MFTEFLDPLDSDLWVCSHCWIVLALPAGKNDSLRIRFWVALFAGGQMLKCLSCFPGFLPELGRLSLAGSGILWGLVWT